MSLTKISKKILAKACHESDTSLASLKTAHETTLAERESACKLHKRLTAKCKAYRKKSLHRRAN